MQFLSMSEKVDDTLLLKDKVTGNITVLYKLEEENNEKTYINLSTKEIAVYITDYFEEKQITRVINKNYYYFTNAEKTEIFNICKEYIENDDINKLKILIKENRISVIMSEIEEYFTTNEKMMLEGFINFRLEKYSIMLENIVEIAVEEFITKREYKEFLKLLKFFVETQVQYKGTAHIVEKNQSYQLLDTNFNVYESEYEIDLKRDMLKGELTNDDILISSLISLSPEKIIVHSSENSKKKELFNTLMYIFGNKITYCKGCNICSKRYTPIK